MATQKKKHLIELMIEAGVKWPDDAEYAAQDKCDSKVYFFHMVPYVATGDEYFCASGGTTGDSYLLPDLCCNWHKTIVTREQYEQALANAAVITEVQTESEHYEPVVSQGPYTINQLADAYYTLAAEAECLQLEANAALKLANEALTALQKAGELLGLVISVADFQKDTEQHQQPVITDWRDLRVGDVIKCVKYGDERDNEWPGGWANSVVNDNHIVGYIDEDDGKITLLDMADSGYAFRFIRRP